MNDLPPNPTGFYTPDDWLVDPDAVGQTVRTIGRGPLIMPASLLAGRDRPVGLGVLSAAGLLVGTGLLLFLQFSGLLH